MKMIVYSNDAEVLVCSEEGEAEMLGMYFADGTGRDKDEYDRYEIDGTVEIRNRMNVSGSRIISPCRLCAKCTKKSVTNKRK